MRLYEVNKNASDDNESNTFRALHDYIYENQITKKQPSFSYRPNSPLIPLWKLKSMVCGNEYIGHEASIRANNTIMISLKKIQWHCFCGIYTKRTGR